MYGSRRCEIDDSYIVLNRSFIIHVFLQVIEEEGSNPAFIPRRDAFWGHDDRWSDMPDEDRYRMI